MSAVGHAVGLCPNHLNFIISQNPLNVYIFFFRLAARGIFAAVFAAFCGISPIIGHIFARTLALSGIFCYTIL